MKSIDFPQSNNVLPTKAGNTPVFIGASGEIISRWQFTWKEIWQIVRIRSIFINQYPQSVAFPQTEIGFRDLTEEEKVELETKELEAKKEQARIRTLQNQQRRNQLRKR